MLDEVIRLLTRWHQDIYSGWYTIKSDIWNQILYYIWNFDMVRKEKNRKIWRYLFLLKAMN